MSGRTARGDPDRRKGDTMNRQHGSRTDFGSRRLFAGRRRMLTPVIAAALAGLAVVTGMAPAPPRSHGQDGLGVPPPEWTANAGAWPAFDYGLNNARATTQSPIDSKTVSKLKVK